MAKRDKKLNEQELTEILGSDRAREVLAQDRRCAKVYGDMERRTEHLKQLCPFPDVEKEAADG